MLYSYETERCGVKVVGSEGKGAGVVALGQTGAGASGERLEEEIRRSLSVVNRRQEGQRKSRIQTREVRVSKRCGKYLLSYASFR